MNLISIYLLLLLTLNPELADQLLIRFLDLLLGQHQVFLLFLHLLGSPERAKLSFVGLFLLLLLIVFATNYRDPFLKRDHVSTYHDMFELPQLVIF